MKKLFLGILLLLVAAAFYTMLTATDRASEVPVITWRTDTNPQREEQIMLFREWLVRNGHIQKDKDGKPVLYTQEEADALNAHYGVKPGEPHSVKAGDKKPNGNVVAETASNQSTLIQAVSGMAGDIVDTAEVLGYQQMGVGVPLTEDANKNGYGLNTTYPGMAGLLVGMDGEQYAYPCNGSSATVWINMDTLNRFGVKEIPEDWTPEDFERIGKEYVMRANEGLQRQEYFFTQSLDSGAGVSLLTNIVRSKGYDLYNETLTRCVADNDIFKKYIKLFYKWTYEDRLVPNAADVASMSTESGYGGADFSNFISGKYAMVVTGRYCLIRFREVQDEKNKALVKEGKEPNFRINFATRLPPQYEFKNFIFGTRAAMFYRGSKQPDLAKLFMQFLASKEYNRYIVERGDGLPPNPSLVMEELKAIPKTRPNEGNVNLQEVEWAMTIGIPGNFSPFVKSGSPNWLQSSINQYFNNRMTLDEAVKHIETRYNMEIETSKKANPRMMEAWKKDWAIQQKIDEYKKAGRKIPAEWIKNPFYLKYYREKGMLRESTPGEKK